jgi:hypothetical protein
LRYEQTPRTHHPIRVAVAINAQGFLIVKK